MYSYILCERGAGTSVIGKVWPTVNSVGTSWM